MKHLKKFKLNEEGLGGYGGQEEVLQGTSPDYLNNGDGGECPSCGSTNFQQGDSSFDEYAEELLVDHKCNECGFEWYLRFILDLDKAYSSAGGEEIYEGEPVDKNSFNVNK